ncbi:hypothetical protein IJ21_12940 [Paenibacillus sp. 32O-W]|nr:hypothetical protein IJ21_12940 [Paenibacillus sp. 32O-W]
MKRERSGCDKFLWGVLRDGHERLSRGRCATGMRGCPGACCATVLSRPIATDTCSLPFSLAV